MKPFIPAIISTVAVIGVVAYSVMVTFAALRVLETATVEDDMMFGIV